MESGLAYAINRAYHAWLKTQPQLVLPGVLDEPHGLPAVGFVEPAPTTQRHLTAAFPRGGLNNGAEPSCESRQTVAAPASSGASAPLSIQGPGRMSTPGERDLGQKGV